MPVEQDIDEGIWVGNRAAMAELGSFDTKVDSPSVNPFDGRALVVDQLVSRTVAVELVAEAGARGIN